MNTETRPLKVSTTSAERCCHLLVSLLFNEHRVRKQRAYFQRAALETYMTICAVCLELKPLTDVALVNKSIPDLLQSSLLVMAALAGKPLESDMAEYLQQIEAMLLALADRVVENMTASRAKLEVV